MRARALPGCEHRHAYGARACARAVQLVYKQGQSRVTKATVTIVFDNRDAKSSPVGYETYEELTITRQARAAARRSGAAAARVRRALQCVAARAAAAIAEP